MSTYLLIYLICVCLFYIGCRFKQHYLYLIALLILIFFGGVRYEVGADYNTYEEIYFFAETTSVEYGYLLLCIYFRLLGFGPQIMFLFSIIVTLYIIYKAILFYNPQQIAFVFFIFLFGGYYAESFNGVRQYIAIAFFMYATRYIISASFKKYLLLILLGSLFHSSILFLIPFYYILRRKYSDITLLIGIVVLLSIAFIFPVSSLYEKIPIYGQRYMVENSHFNQNANLGIGYLSKLIIGLMLIKLRHLLIQKDDNYNLVINSFFFYILFMAIFKDFMVFLRIAYYFHIFLILILPKLCSCFTPQSRLWGRMLICLYVLLLFVVQMTEKNGMLIPYQMNLDFR